MKNNILLIGLGYFGKKAAQELADYQQDVMAIDTDPDRVNSVLPYVTNARIGNTSDETFVQSLGVKDYDVCIVAIGDDFLSSLQTTALLKDNGAKYIVARAASDAQEKLLKRVGADAIVFPEKTLAVWTAVRYAANHIFDYLALDDQYSILEIDVPDKWKGKSVKELDVRRKYHLNIIGTKVNNVLNPDIDPNAPLSEDVRLLVLGKEKDIRILFNR